MQNLETSFQTANTAASSNKLIGGFRNYVYGFCKAVMPKSVHEYLYRDTARYKVDEIKDTVSIEPVAPASPSSSI